jgi:hypothetical protein
MAQYTQAQLISASNATYVTNTSGSITAADVRSLNNTWISSSALVSQSNTFNGNQIISGGLDVTGNLTASLQTGYVWVGVGNKATQIATSSLITNVNTGSFLTTGSDALTQKFFGILRATSSVSSQYSQYSNVGFGVYSTTANASMGPNSMIISSSLGQTTYNPNGYFASVPNSGTASVVLNGGRTELTTNNNLNIQVNGSGNLTLKTIGAGRVVVDDALTVNNDTIINGNETLNNGSISIIGNNQGINLSSNTDGSGSAYAILSANVDNTTDPTNVYSAFQLPDPQNNTNFGMSWNSYTPYYSTSTPMIIANQYYNDSDVAIAFPTNKIEVWKPIEFKAPMTASLQKDYIWIGNASGKSVAVATSSLSIQGAQGVSGQNGTQGPQGTAGTPGGAGQMGTQGAQGVSGSNGTQGATGTQGAAGQLGTQGTTGAQGAAGSGGQQGTQGAQGSTGAGTQGATGIGFYWQGTWNSGTTYVVNDITYRGGDTWISLQNSNTNHDPQTSPTYWTLFTAQGDTGFQGPQGVIGQSVTGAQGPQGPSGTGGQQGTQGAQGATGTGATGQGYTWKGAWSSVTAYVPYDTVSYNGSSYVSILGGTNQNPATATTYWSLIAAQGSTGAQGATGAAGQNGSAGPQGATGSTGSAGQQGTQGATGANGATGTQGATGATGGTGTQGATGATGGTGSTGAQGAQGYVGGTGATGAQGATGSSAQVIINSNVDNYVLTATGGSALQGESGLQYNGSTLSVSGAITATGNITAYYSDGRLKEILSKIDSPLEKLKAISGYYYTQNKLAEEFGYNDYSKQIGVIAQEIEAVIPEAIARAPFDDDGFGGSKTGENYLAVHYEKIIPLLIEAIKELESKIK